MLIKSVLTFCLFFLLQTQTMGQSPLKNYTFTDQAGKNFQLHDIKGQYLFVSFVYTRCPMPKMCPLTMSLNKQVFNLWKKKAASIPLKFLVVTLDPANDSPTVLKTYATKFGLDSQGFILVTGQEQTISDFSAEFNAIGFPSNGLIAHSSRSVLVSPELVPLKDYNDNEWKPESVIKDLLNYHSKSEKKS